MRHGKDSRDAGLSQDDSLLTDIGLNLEIHALLQDSLDLIVINLVEINNVINHSQVGLLIQRL